VGHDALADLCQGRQLWTHQSITLLIRALSGDAATHQVDHATDACTFCFLLTFSFF
jgi:hypothetical protein